MCSPAIFNLIPHPLLGQDPAVAACTGHCVIGIGHGDDPRLFRNGIPEQTVWISPAVITFMMPVSSHGKLRPLLDISQYAFSKNRMGLDDGKFLISKPGWLVDHTVRHADLADVVQQAHHIDPVLLLPGISESPRDLPCVICHTAGVTVRISILGVDRLRQGLYNTKRQVFIFLSFKLNFLRQIPLESDQLNDMLHARYENARNERLLDEVHGPQLQAFHLVFEVLDGCQEYDGYLLPRHFLLP